VAFRIYREPVRALAEQRGVFGSIAKEFLVTAAESHLKLERAAFQKFGQ
jgi:hypothetical protein